MTKVERGREGYFVDNLIAASVAKSQVAGGTRLFATAQNKNKLSKSSQSLKLKNNCVYGGGFFFSM
jgi:hypothetical protein